MREAWTKAGHALVVSHGGFGIDHGRKPGRIWRDNGVVAEAAFVSEVGHAEARILISLLHIARVERGF